MRGSEEAAEFSCAGEQQDDLEALQGLLREEVH
jgi:hypothetical protein